MRTLLEAPPRDTVRGRRDLALFELLYATGLRVSELVRLRIADLRIADGYLFAFGKGSKERIVPLGEEAARWLAAYLSEVRPGQARRA